MTPHEYRRLWLSKPATRRIYRDMYRRAAASFVPGPVLEIGGGAGNFKAERPEAISGDIRPAPWVDVVFDAHRPPFAAGQFNNLIMVDVLHHLERPRYFFAQALRLLKPGGRLVMVEPAITPLSRFVYHYFHPEPVRMHDDPLSEGTLDPNRHPFDANQAIPTLLFGRSTERFRSHFPELTLLRQENFSFFIYPLSGGFRPWSLVPAWAVGPGLAVEEALRPILAPLMAFRMLVVLERR